MESSRFLETVRNSNLAKHLEFFKCVVRPAVEIRRSERRVELGGSRFGGLPELPVGADWPTHAEGPYRFLGQINFSEVPTEGLELPESGLLSLFVADDPTGETEYFWGDDGYVRAFWFPDVPPLEPLSPPNAEETQPSTALSFHSTLDLPYDETQVQDWPFDAREVDLYRELRQSLHQTGDYLLGYPSHTSLAYDPTPPGWRSLITVASDDSLDWCWHDGDKLMIFIEPSRLKQRIFHELKSDAG